MLQQFIDRKYELEFLNNKYLEDKAELIIIYGRRRIGKTELIKKFIENREFIYHLCTYDSLEENLTSIKYEFYRITGREYFKDLKSSIFDLFKYFAGEIGNKQIIIAFDEFQYLIQLNTGIVSVLQKVYDEILKNTKIFLILSGSSVSMLEDEILSYKSPLYGRRTGSIELNGFDIISISNFYNKNFEDIVKINSIFGSIPFYLSLIDKSDSIEQNVKNRILRKGEILYEEPKILLKEEFREPRVYELILKNISMGYNRFGELQNKINMDKGNISKYLETLESSRFIKYILPLGQKRNGIYEINDYFLNFYYKFVYPNLSELELNNVESVYLKIKKDINTYFGYTFERIILDMISRHIIRIPFNNFELKRFWHKDIEIDGIAVNNEKNELLFIEIKFSSNVDGIRIFNDLKYKALKVDYRRDKEYYMIIARSFKNKSEDAINMDFNYINDSIFAKTH